MVGSCTWLIRTVHSQLVVLRCRARRLAVQAHLHTRCLFTHQHTPLGFHIYFAFFFFFPHLCLCPHTCSPTFYLFALHAFESLYANVPCDSDVDNGCAIVGGIAVSVVTVLWAVVNPPRAQYCKQDAPSHRACDADTPDFISPVRKWVRSIGRRRDPCRNKCIKRKHVVVCVTAELGYVMQKNKRRVGKRKICRTSLRTDSVLKGQFSPEYVFFLWPEGAIYPSRLRCE